MIDALIFDVDGTLWDSRPVVAASWNQAVVDVCGQHPGYTPENITYLFGKTMTEIAFCLFPQLEEAERMKLAKTCFRYENEWLETTSGDFYPGVIQGMKELKKKYPLYILSNCQAGYIELMLKHCGLADLFEGWMCFDDTGLSKGENLKLLVKKYGLKHPIYVGDTQGDWNACQTAGVSMIFCAYGLGQVDDPLPTIHSFSQLESLVDSL